MPHFPEERPVEDSSSATQELTVNAPVADNRIRVKNRRKRYLDLHPEYYKSSNLEIAEPLLYDRLVRRFQTAEEREREGRDRGYSGVLEANLVRSEAKLDSLAHPDPNSPMVYRRAEDGSIVGIEQDEEDRTENKEDGWERWTDVMGQRFLAGRDRDFEYEEVDDNEEFDDREEEERSRQQVYFDAEEETFVGDGQPQGQTGVQDY